CGRRRVRIDHPRRLRNRQRATAKEGGPGDHQARYFHDVYTAYPGSIRIGLNTMDGLPAIQLGSLQGHPRAYLREYNKRGIQADIEITGLCNCSDLLQRNRNPSRDLECKLFSASRPLTSQALTLQPLRLVSTSHPERRAHA